MIFTYVERTRDLLVLENPSKPLNGFHFRRAVGTKKLTNLTIRNLRTEIYETDVIDPRSLDCADCSPVEEPISVRLIVSGSAPAQNRLKQMVQNVTAAYLENFSSNQNGSLPPSNVVVKNDVVLTIS